MADKSSQLVLNALTQAATAGTGLPLVGTRTAPGLFPPTALGKQAAQRCCDEGYLRPARLEPGPGPNPRPRIDPTDLCAITDKGLRYLLAQVSPRQVLEDLVRVLEQRETQVAQLLSTARQMQTGLEGVRQLLAPVLNQLAGPAAPLPEQPADLKALFRSFRGEPAATPGTDDPGSPVDASASPQTPVAPGSPPAHGSPPVEDLIREHLARWSGPARQGEGNGDGGRPSVAHDCPLPELFRRVEKERPGLTVGGFHDALRALHSCGQVYLHPWAGPLYDLPEPAFALLAGHLVAYYASPRS